MDPTLFLSSQSFQNSAPTTPRPDEIDTFYKTHGPCPLSALSHWQAALSAVWHRVRIGRTKTGDIAPLPRHS